jgi:hypothetical protein
MPRLCAVNVDFGAVSGSVADNMAAASGISERQASVIEDVIEVPVIAFPIGITYNVRLSLSLSHTPGLSSPDVSTGSFRYRSW